MSKVNQLGAPQSDQRVGNLFLEKVGNMLMRHILLLLIVNDLKGSYSNDLFQ